MYSIERGGTCHILPRIVSHTPTQSADNFVIYPHVHSIQILGDYVCVRLPHE